VTAQVALLRGINLAGRRRVSMPALRALLAEAGYGDVRTYVQSGNVVLTSPVEPAQLEAELERLLTAEFGFEVDVFVRTRAELARIVAANPLAEVADDPRRYQVSFLRKALPARVARELEAADVAPERVAVRGREIYAWHPPGVGRSPLAKLLTDRSLGATTTARNWRTVEELLALAGG
jgi:uncharacterized protein (DUF1697 family)